MPEPISKNDVPAIILCGGRSRRMGLDKSSLPFGRGTVLQRIETIFFQFAKRVTVVISHDAPKPNVGENTDIIRDENTDFGPLEGLRVGINHHARDSEFVFVGTCDAPLVIPDVYREMLNRLVQNEDCHATIPVIDKQLYPLTGVYRTSLVDTIGEMVANEELRVRDLFSRINFVAVGANELRTIDPDLNTIKNMNNQQEYRQMLASADETPGES